MYLPRWEAGVESRHLGARASNASLNARLAKGTSEAFEALGQLAEGLQKAGIAFSFEGTQGAGHLRVKIVEDRPDLLVLAPPRDDVRHELRRRRRGAHPRAAGAPRLCEGAV